MQLKLYSVPGVGKLGDFQSKERAVQDDDEEELKGGVRGPLIKATLLYTPHGMFRNVLHTVQIVSGISKLHMSYIME